MSFRKILLFVLCAGVFHVPLGAQIKSTLTCTINGKPFKATQAFGTIENQLSDGTLQIFATDGKITIELLLEDKKSTNRATLSIEGGISLSAREDDVYAILPDKVNVTLEKRCVATITRRTSTSVSGTFVFTAANAIIKPTKWVTVAQGKFEVAIQKEE
ncbi:MAG TPA: hypothetical protein PKD90_00530 [Phnomibacter sp.]|nr:hypothetical protein [Phnomibacter sp.]